MNDNRSHDYDNYVNSYGIREIRREAANAHMLKEAGLSGSSWLVRTVAGLGKLLVGMRKRSQDQENRQRELSVPRQQYEE